VVFDEEILTVEEASALLRVSSKTILRLAREGALPGQKVGRAWRFCRSELVAYVARIDRSSGAAV
jgi:excisionase family DNA binding protein